MAKIIDNLNNTVRGTSSIVSGILTLGKVVLSVFGALILAIVAVLSFPVLIVKKIKNK